MSKRVVVHVRELSVAKRSELLMQIQEILWWIDVEKGFDPSSGWDPEKDWDSSQLEQIAKVMADAGLRPTRCTRK